jgi:hypothetical protein
MSKTVLPSKFQELKGLDRISSTVHDMKCFFRELSKDDVGIDGEIEVLVPKPDGPGFMTTGGIVKVQAKSGDSFVVQDTQDSFATPVKLSDLQYWHSATFPVLFVVYHPGDDKLYYREVQSYIRQAPLVWQPPHRIVFEKRRDVFSSDSRDQIAELAQVSPPRVSRQQKERLFSNLFLVKRLPRLITHGPTEHKDARQIRQQIQGFVPPFCVVEGRIYTLSDLRDTKCILREYCDPTQIGEVLADHWMNDQARRRDYVFMLNQLLTIHLRRCGVRFWSDPKRYYFPRPDDEELEYKQDWRNVRTGRTAPQRIVVKYYEYGLDLFWRHLAVTLSFKQFGTSWFLQAIPKYHLTSDGRHIYDPERTGPLVTKLKAMERNIHVLNHNLFWADVLSQRSPTIQVQLDRRTAMVIEKMPYSGVADFAIPDDPAVFEEPPEVAQTSFLGLLSTGIGDSDVDERTGDTQTRWIEGVENTEDADEH